MNKNLILVWLIGLSVAIALLFAPIYAGGEEKSRGVSESGSEQENVSESDTMSQREQEMYDEILRVSYIEDREEWFIEYKKLHEEYPEFLAKPETIYDVYTDEELDKLFRVIAAEATAGGFQEKVNVAVVVFNRINSEDFKDTIDGVLTESQFSPLKDGRWLEVEVDETTILACEYSYIFGMSEHSAVFFENENSDVHSAYADFVFQDSIGHKFFEKRVD